MTNGSAYSSYYEMLREEVTAYDGENAEFIHLAPGLYRLMLALLDDNRIKKRGRQLLGIALGYLVAPYDIIPEEIKGPAGYIDDVFVCLYVLKRMRRSLDDQVLVENWEDEGDILEILDTGYPKVRNAVKDIQKDILEYIGLR